MLILPFLLQICSSPVIKSLDGGHLSQILWPESYRPEANAFHDIKKNKIKRILKIHISFNIFIRSYSKKKGGTDDNSNNKELMNRFSSFDKHLETNVVL